jgi:hypothetical protein
MTGPAHYLKAEEHLAFAASSGTSDSLWHQRQAKVHATLALAAAQAMAALGEMPVFDADAWQDTAGTQPGQAGDKP